MCFWNNQVWIRNSISEVFLNKNWLFLEPNYLFPRLRTAGNRCSCCPSSFSMDLIFRAVDSFPRSPCSGWLQKASPCSSPPSPQNIQTVKRYWQRLRNTMRQQRKQQQPCTLQASPSHLPLLILRRKGKCLVNQRPPSWQRKRQRKGYLLPSLRKVLSLRSRFFPALAWNKLPQNRETGIRRCQLLLPFAGTDLSRKQWQQLLFYTHFPLKLHSAICTRQKKKTLPTASWWEIFSLAFLPSWKWPFSNYRFFCLADSCIHSFCIWF